MAKIKRQFKFKPKQFSDYGKYKPYLRLEFLYACVYCDVYECESAGEDNFQIDHWAPQSKFKMLRCIYENLFYSCATCNGINAKSSFWPTKADRENGRIILNPVRHDIEAHIDKSQARWRGISDEGIWNVERFALDSDFFEEVRTKRVLNPISNAQTNAANVDRILQSFGTLLTDQEKQDLLRINQVLRAITVSHRRLDSRWPKK
jgi:hypothetical protein